jgi:HK97 family phage major capsid protein
MEDLNFDVFDNAEQKKVLVDLAEQIKKTKAEDTSDDFGFEDTELVKKDRKNLNKVRKIWDRGGKIDGSDQKVSIDELLVKDIEVTNKMRDNFSTDLPLLIPRTLANIVREAIEPNLVLTPLLTRINYSAGTRVSFPAYGALANAAADLAEGEEYPEGTMELGGQTECIIGKSGIAVKVTEEQKRYSQFDIISMNVRQAGRALARLKERKVADLITTNGTILIDNDAGGTYRRTTGRDAAGAYNGTLTLDDIFNVWAVMVNSGFVMNTLIMHPFAWKIFAEENMARLFGFTHNIPSMLWQMPGGSPGNAPNWRQTALNQNTYVTDPQNVATTFTKVPSIFPTQFNVIVSPYMPFTASSSKTDIVFCDVNELGILVVDEDVTSDEWTDPSKDIMKMKFRERYGLAVKNDGRGIAILKNIVIGKNYDFADRMVFNVTGLTSGLALDQTVGRQLL